MNNVQKHTVVKLRKQGYGYKKIATHLGVTIDQPKKSWKNGSKVALDQA